MVSSIRRIKSPTEVDHYQLRRVIDIYVQPVGEDLGRIAAAIEDLRAQTTLPDGLRQYSDRGVHAPSARGGHAGSAGRREGGPRAFATGADDLARDDDRPAADGAEAGDRQRSLRAAGPRGRGRHDGLAHDDRNHGAG